MIFCLIAVLVACGSKDQDNTPIPSGILTQREFTEVLVIYTLSESAANLNIKSARPEKMDSVYAFNPLKEKGIRKAQFDSTLDFYAGHPVLYRQVYDSVLVRLNALRVSREIIKTDSLSK
jgi:hypothetical protein